MRDTRGNSSDDFRFLGQYSILKSSANTEISICASCVCVCVCGWVGGWGDCYGAAWVRGRDRCMGVCLNSCIFNLYLNWLAHFSRMCVCIYIYSVCVCTRACVCVCVCMCMHVCVIVNALGLHYSSFVFILLMTVHNSNFRCLQRTKKYSQVFINSRCWLSVSSAQTSWSRPHSLISWPGQRTDRVYCTCRWLSLGAATNIFVVTNTHFVATKVCLSWQKYFVVRKLLSPSTILSRQKLS